MEELYNYDSLWEVEASPVPLTEMYRSPSALDFEKAMQEMMAFHSHSLSPPTPDQHAAPNSRAVDPSPLWDAETGVFESLSFPVAENNVMNPSNSLELLEKSLQETVIEVPSSPLAQPSSHVDAELGATASLPPHPHYTPQFNPSYLSFEGGSDDGGDDEVVETPQPQPSTSQAQAQARDALKTKLDSCIALYLQPQDSQAKLTKLMSQADPKEIQGESTNSKSSEEQQLGDPSKEESEITKSTDLDDEKRARRKLANRDSARRFRQKKEDEATNLKAQVASLQAQVASLQAQNSKLSLQYSELSLRYWELKAENSKLSDRLASQNKNTVDVMYQSLKADIQNLKDEAFKQLKLLQKTIETSILSSTKDISISSTPSSTRPCERDSNSEVILVPEDSSCFGEAFEDKKTIDTFISSSTKGISISSMPSSTRPSEKDLNSEVILVPEGSSCFTKVFIDKKTMNSDFSMPVCNTLCEEGISNVTNGKEKLGRSESMLRVASLEHIKKRACSGRNKFHME